MSSCLSSGRMRCGSGVGHRTLIHSCSLRTNRKVKVTTIMFYKCFSCAGAYLRLGDLRIIHLSFEIFLEVVADARGYAVEMRHCMQPVLGSQVRVAFLSAGNKARRIELTSMWSCEARLHSHAKTKTTTKTKTNTNRTYNTSVAILAQVRGLLL